MKHTHESLIVFDMDGVLVDVSGSYREAVRHTARHFFSGAAGCEKLPDPLFSLADLAAVKQSGGLNNDWDLTHAILGLLFTRVACPLIVENPDPWSRYRSTVKTCDVSALADYLTAMERPVSAMLERTGRTRHEFVDSVYTGDVGTGNIIKQIFQELYLGEHLFTATYDFQPRAYSGDGFIARESLLCRPAVLAALAETHTLAVATGRPGAEADHPLRRFDIQKYFARVYTLDDCLREEKRRRSELGETLRLSKPNPFMLDALAGDLETPAARCYYIGDMPDDMVAAKNARAPYVAVGIAASSPDRDRLKTDLIRAGADIVIDDFEQLMDAVNYPFSGKDTR